MQSPVLNQTDKVCKVKRDESMAIDTDSGRVLFG
jgi:hypothetical protein